MNEQPGKNLAVTEQLMFVDSFIAIFNLFYGENVKIPWVHKLGLFLMRACTYEYCISK